MLERFHIKDVRIALAAFCYYSMAHGIAMTYVGAVITTIEKRFNLTAVDIGWILGANDIGYLTCILFVSYLGSRGNKPFMLSLSVIGLWIACLLLASPYFIFGPKLTVEELLSQTPTSSAVNRSLCFQDSNRNITTTDMVDKNQRSYLISFIIQMVGGILSGIASSPFWNIGVSLLDDMSHEKSGFYLGILFTVRGMSPVFGFLFAGWCIRQHETMQISSKMVPGGEKNPQFIGAWWFGWVIAGFAVLIAAPIVGLLRMDTPSESSKPRKAEDGAMQPMLEMKESTNEVEQMPSLESKADSVDESDDKIDLSWFETLSFKEMLSIIWELLQSRVYLYMLIGMVFEMTGLLTAFTFFSKYLTYYFLVSFSTASIMTAVTLSSSHIISCTVSALLSKFTNWNIRQMNYYHFVVNFISAIAFASLMFIKCDPPKIKGINSDLSFLQSNCSTSCNCLRTSYMPVCYDQETYFSPCEAGCMFKLNDTTFGGCGCVQDNDSDLATIGTCEKMCSNVYIYLGLFFIIKVIGGMANVQFSTIVLRQTTSDKKPLCLGLIGLIFGILGVCLPPVGGKLFDMVCLLQNVEGNSKAKGYCLLYDSEKLRWFYNGLAMIFQLPACLFYYLSYYHTPSIPATRKELHQPEVSKKVVLGEAMKPVDMTGSSVDV